MRTAETVPNHRRRALIFGISGQDGAYLARRLIADRYEVFGTSRDKEQANLSRLHRLGIVGDVSVASAAMSDFRSVLQVIDDVRPDEIYNLGGQSSVGLSFVTPVETFDSIVVGTLNILESMRFLKSEARFYNACSSEVFGDTLAGGADEDTPMRPRSPYAVAKAAAHWAVANYREAYGLFACSGFLFNHESPLRPPRFVTQKVVSGAIEIATGKRSKLELGDLSIARDWGWAPDYVEAMRQMLRQDSAEDFVIATGRASTLEEFVQQAFQCVGLDWREHVTFDPALRRPTELSFSVGNPAKARDQLAWSATVQMPELVQRLVAAQRDLHRDDQSGPSKEGSNVRD